MPVDVIIVCYLLLYVVRRIHLLNREKPGDQDNSSPLSIHHPLSQLFARTVSHLIREQQSESEEENQSYLDLSYMMRRLRQEIAPP